MKGSIWPDRGVAHEWRRLPNGRFAATCGVEPDRWSEPYSRTEAEPCRLCDDVDGLLPEAEKLVGTYLAHRWPRSFTLSEIERGVGLRGLGRARTLRVLRELVDARLVFVYVVTEKTARRHWVAGRRLVESVGRRYGL